MGQSEAIMHTVNQLADLAENENPNGYDIANAFGEMKIKGIEYQMQICLIANKKLWLPENQARFQEIVTIHD